MSVDTVKLYKLELYDEERIEGKYDMPTLEPSSTIPEGLIGFDWLWRTRRFERHVHFFEDDWRFERIWTAPYRYLDKLKQFGGVLTPDFSLYVDMPLSMQIWNTYRNRMLGQLWQDEGLDVIPTVSWSDERSFDFCFDGLPKHSVLARSTSGCVKSKAMREMWYRGMDEMMERLEPSAVIIYGKRLDYPADNIIWFDSEMHERFDKLHGGEDDGTGELR